MTNTEYGKEDEVKQARQCLELIGKIAHRAARSGNPDEISYALQELTQVLLERTGTEERMFEPIPVGEIEGLSKLIAELDFVNGCSQDLASSRRQNERAGALA